MSYRRIRHSTTRYNTASVEVVLLVDDTTNAAKAVIEIVGHRQSVLTVVETLSAAVRAGNVNFHVLGGWSGFRRIRRTVEVDASKAYRVVSVLDDFATELINA